VTKQDNEGEDLEVFVKLGPDHYGHAISYLNIACEALDERMLSNYGVVTPSSVTTFKTQGNANAA